MPEVDPEFIVHKFNVDPSFPPKKQKSRRSAKEHIEAVRQEVGRLKEARVINEIFFPEWLANTVVVRKKNGKWKVSRFHGFELSMPKSPIPYAKNRSIGRRHLWAPEDEFPRHLSRLSSDRSNCQGPGEDGIHLP